MGPSYHSTVTIFCDDGDIRGAFQHWLESEHLDDVLAAGAASAELVRRDDALALEVRYTFTSREAFVTYETEEAPRLRQVVRERFPSGVRFERTTGSLPAAT